MIGIFGGSFDPVHYGHLKSAEALKKELQLEKLFLMPCANPVHKKGLFFSANQRIKMLDLALLEYPELSIDLREVERGGSSYSIDSVKAIKQEYPKTPVCWVIGMDSFLHFNTWKDWQNFKNYAHLIVLSRPGYSKTQQSFGFQKTDNLEYLSGQHSGCVYFAKTPLMDLSSSEIRSKIQSQQDLGDWVPKPVIHQIQKYHDT